MFRVSSALTQAAQIKPELNGPDDWVKWNQNFNGTLVISNLWRLFISKKLLPAKINESFAS